MPLALGTTPSGTAAGDIPWPSRAPEAAAVDGVRTVATVDGIDRVAARLRLAHDFLDLGAPGLALEVVDGTSDVDAFAAARFLVATRGRIDAGDDEAVHRASRSGPWDALREPHRSELAWLTAVACHRTGRHVAARRWLDEVDPASPSAPFAAHLRTQVEIALDRPDRALAAAAALFEETPANVVEAGVQRETALLVGKMLLELDLPEMAAETFAWIPDEGATGAEAVWGLALARALARSGDVASVDRLLEARADALDRLTAAPDRIAAFAAHPARNGAIRARRASFDDLVETGAVRARGWSLRRVGSVVWASLPPVVLWKLLRRGADPWPEGAAADAPPPALRPTETVEHLAGAAASFRRTADAASCAERAGSSLRLLLAEARAGIAPIPRLGDLASVAAGCERGRMSRLDDVDRALTERLAALVDGEVRKLRLQRTALEEALGRARLEEHSRIREERLQR